MFVFVQRHVGAPVEIADRTLISHEVVEVFISHFICLVDLVPKAASSALQLREPCAAVNFECA